MAVTYGKFRLAQAWLQLRHALRVRANADAQADVLMRRLRAHEARIVKSLGRPLRDLSILEIGPGQGYRRARYYAACNRVVAIDLDVIPRGKWNLRSYGRMLRQNGLGRVLKTAARGVVLGSSEDAAWGRAAGGHGLGLPRLIQGDVCESLGAIGGPFDLIVSWSAFEHLAAPERALRNVIGGLAPGGAVYISIHLYTSHTGHHDIRAFTGGARDPPPWARLRASTNAEVRPSAFLNRWRLDRWRELFHRLAPGNLEYRDEDQQRAWLGERVSPELEHELAGYSDEELHTVDLSYAWRKP